MKIMIGPKQIADLFLMAQAHMTPEEASIKLSLVIELSFTSGVNAALDEAKKIYRELHSGGCRIASQGSLCTCFLCQMDKLRTSN